MKIFNVFLTALSFQPKQKNFTGKSYYFSQNLRLESKTELLWDDDSKNSFLIINHQQNDFTSSNQYMQQNLSFSSKTG